MSCKAPLFRASSGGLECGLRSLTYAVAATSMEDPEGTVDGHLLDADGVVVGDYFLQIHQAGAEDPSSC